ncbi:lecithin--cholesterol acyltransferase [Aceticella autotrophica]|uniref:Lecithin--cholesterol acyltransferase n=1 Tax=Aceticella autotrophica TaxID=2755338 RepID=A0A975AVF1_9THEO|nr:lecithin--cholesterol acyltransferase [Aceticella autotrophica]QSZ27184.1 lecithin--cholesterol acyltransferase [Aceticella autotrophica]
MKLPLIFIHGIFGSIFVPTPLGKIWTFGPAGYIYDPFVENLKTLGYTEDKNLFICYYEWWKKVPDCINTLISKIDQAKIKNASDKVDVICHSMGGLLARSYIQSCYYRNDIDKLIFLSTPHYGAANAYYAWEGGAVPPGDDDDFTNILLRGFLWTIGKIKGEKDELMIIRNFIQSINNLMPTFDYGNYIFKYPIVNNKVIFKNIHYMKEKNQFLNQLNNNIDLLYERVKKIYLFSGNNIYTNKFIQVKEPVDDILWPDGEAIGVVRDNKGDGTVLNKSALGIKGEQYTLDVGHGGILNASIPILKDILGVEKSPKMNILEKIASFINILTDKKIVVLDREKRLKRYNVFGKINWYMDINNKGEYYISAKEPLENEILIATNKGHIHKKLRRLSRLLRSHKLTVSVDEKGNFEIKDV